MDDEIHSLITSIIEAQDEIEMLKVESRLEKNKARLKELLALRLIGNAEKVEVVHDGVRAKLSLRAQAPKIDRKKLKEFLHPNTYKLIVTEKEPSKVLEIEHV